MERVLRNRLWLTGKRLSFLTGFAFLIGITLSAFHLWPPMSTPARTLAICLLVAPALIFVFFNYLYDSFYPARSQTSWFMFRSLLVSVALLLPAALLLSRYYIDPGLAWQIVSFSPIPWAFLERYLQPKTRSTLLTAHFLEIMVDAWRPGYRPFERQLGEISQTQAYEKFRFSSYTTKEAIATFQRTLSCPEIEGSVVADALRTWHSGLAKGWTLVDIGGGDGRFTRNLLTGLGVKPESVGGVLLADPENWSDEYQANVGGVLGGVTIDYLGQGQGALEVEGSYDLVLASHSLYASLDAHKQYHQWPRSILLPHLRKLRKPEGRVVIILASSLSRAYAFKREALQAVFGDVIEDSTIESLVPALPGVNWQKITVDNVMDLSHAIEHMDKGMPTNLDLWLSYFLRVDRSLVEQNRSVLIEVLHSYLVQFSELPSCFQTQLEGITLPHLRAESQVLTHKVVALVSED